MSITVCFVRLDEQQQQRLQSALDGRGEWGGVVAGLLCSLVLLSTCCFALSTEPTLPASALDLLTGAEALCTLVFSAEYVLRLALAKDKLQYALSFLALVDLLSVLPSWLDLLLPGDVFPAMQFLRMLRLFKFLATSKRGRRGVEAFLRSWGDNEAIIKAAAFAGGAVWLVTASLQYLAERDNKEMDWCFPRQGEGDADVGDCVCDDDSCEGSGCECVARFSSIPSSMFFVLLNLSGEFPLAETHSPFGRFVAACTAVVSVAIFAIPTGLVGAALEDSISALNSGSEEDYDVDDEDAAAIAAETRRREKEQEAVPVPIFTTTVRYKKTCGLIIMLSAIFSILSTVPSLPHTLLLVCHGVDLFCAYFFGVEHVARVLAMGPKNAADRLCGDFMFVVDSMSWLPTVLYLLGGKISCPPYIFLVVSFFRLLKYERYIKGFAILSKIIHMSGGVLAIGGAAATCCLVFSSALMYYAERNNPDPNMRKYYSSVPTAMWMTLLNLSGEAPLCDYTLVGRIIVGLLSFVAIPIFGIPIGALGAGFEGVISELATGDDCDNNSTEGTSDENKRLLDEKKSKYGSLTEMTSFREETEREEEFVRAEAALSPTQRIVEGKGNAGQKFQAVSIFATLFAVALEVVSTCEFASASPSAITTINALEIIVVVWFTIEYGLRVSANGFAYIFSWLGVVDFLATFPYYIAHGALGPQAESIVNVYDGPLRGLRLLRLIRLDSYAPSLSLVDDAFRNCWSGLKLALYAGTCVWFGFIMLLYFAEVNDEAGGEAKRFRNALSSVQYSGILLTGDYPIKDFSVWGKLLCCASVIVAVGIVSVPASVLSNAFVELLQGNANEARERRRNAAIKMQRIFKNRKNMMSAASNAFANLVNEARTKSAMLRGLDSGDNFVAKLCMWKNGSLSSATLFRSVSGVLVAMNILAVILESMVSIEKAVPHWIWQTFETVSVLFFTAEYILDVVTAKYDPKYNFSRWNKVYSFVGIAELLSVAPFYFENILFPLFAPSIVFDSTIFRIMRLARILELERFFQSFTLLDDVFSKSGPVLKATGVLALIVWVGGATIFYYVEPHDERYAEAAAQGGEDAAVFVSIVDSLYYVAIFLAGEWAVCDFTPLGAVASTVMAAIGVALFSIPVGVLFEGFQEMLEEKHSA